MSNKNDTLEMLKACATIAHKCVTDLEAKIAELEVELVSEQSVESIVIDFKNWYNKEFANDDILDMYEVHKYIEYRDESN